MLSYAWPASAREALVGLVAMASSLAAPVKEQVGSWLQIELKEEGSPTIVGQLFNYDNVLKLLILLEPIIPVDYEELPLPVRPAISHAAKIISLSAIKSLKHLPIPLATSIDLPTVKPIRADKLARKETRLIQKRQELFGSHAPSGTSKEALNIFSALSKT